jgi:haloalkane dehalogenase|tara:strand:- start:1366 stop:2775 length:1410 start_codon:yes stop_codon:yes gene_type:complete
MTSKREFGSTITEHADVQWRKAHEHATTLPAADFPYEYKFVEIDGNRIAYIEKGEGDPILFIHGAPTSSYLWRNILPWMSDRGRCISMDLIGFGQSDKPKDHFGYFIHTDYVRKFIEALDLKNITLVLHDWGFNYGMEYTVDHPENVKGVCYGEALMSPRYPIDDTESYGKECPGVLNMYRTMQSEAGHDIAVTQNLFVERVMPEHIYRKMTQAEMMHYRQPFFNVEDRGPILQMPRDVPLDGEPADIRASYTKYNDWFESDNKTVPTLHVYATPGAVNTTEDAAWMCNNIRNHESAWIGTGIHYIQEDNPEGWGRALRDWHRRIDHSLPGSSAMSAGGLSEFVQNNIYANFEAGNIEGVLANFHPDIKFTHHGPRDQIPFAGEWNGIEGAGQMLLTFAETVEPVFVNVKDITASGNKVIVSINESYKVKATGKVYVTDVAHIWTIEGETVVQFDELYDSAAIANAFLP